MTPSDPRADPQQLFEKAEALRKEVGESLHDQFTESIYSRARAIALRAVSTERPTRRDWDQTLDSILTSRTFGFPIMLAILAVVFWVTIVGANAPSAMIATWLFWLEERLAWAFQGLGAPWWLEGFFVHGVYRALAWVVAVMLPPMAIFFPIFTLLEDMGYLPRVAFNMDRFFRMAGAHGKQALTMSMGFGCNAAGVIACRIIESPRERLIAIITNNFVPCNGRWPTIIMLASLFVAAAFPAGLASIAAAATVVGVTLFGVLVTLLVSAFLSRTWLKGEASSFTLELPPYRRPQLLRVLYTSLIDRTIYVLGRAVVMAAPAGGLIWILGNTTWGGTSLMAHGASLFDPVGRAIGLDGIILLAFVIAIPANEIIVPTIIMGYMGMGMMTDIGSAVQLKALFAANGWTLLTALSVMLFSLLHYPCSTTTWTIWKETRSVKWTAVANLLPLAVAFAVGFTLTQVVGLLRVS